MADHIPERVADTEWVAFPGGELEGRRLRALCASCQRRVQAGEPRLPLCFECYRVDRQKTASAAGSTSAEPGSSSRANQRWQWLLPFEPVNVERLSRLRADRSAARMSSQAGTGRYVDKRRHAQIAARHALQQIAAGLEARQQSARGGSSGALADATHAAELQLPEAWLRFVVAR